MADLKKLLQKVGRSMTVHEVIYTTDSTAPQKEATKSRKRRPDVLGHLLESDAEMVQLHLRTPAKTLKS